MKVYIVMKESDFHKEVHGVWANHEAAQAVIFVFHSNPNNTGYWAWIEEYEVNV